MISQETKHQILKELTWWLILTIILTPFAIILYINYPTTMTATRETTKLNLETITVITMIIIYGISAEHITTHITNHIYHSA